mmetsp:Transcript_2036/g.4658  ORF Transcript_2036/g.4658 Transcript_2036/m.4658 type:complete len:639 (-) Transcript_2036:1453-3369(-)
MSKPYVVKESPRFKPYKTLTFHEPEHRALRPEDLISSMKQSLSAWHNEDETGQELKNEIEKYAKSRSSQSLSQSRYKKSTRFEATETSSRFRGLIDPEMKVFMNGYFNDLDEIPLKSFYAALEFEFSYAFDQCKPHELLGTILADESNPRLLSVSKLNDFSKAGFRSAVAKLMDKTRTARTVNEQIVEELEALKNLLQQQAEQQKQQASKLKVKELKLKEKEAEMKQTLERHAGALLEEGHLKLQGYVDKMEKLHKSREAGLKESQSTLLKSRLTESLHMKSTVINPRIKSLERALEHTKDKLATINAENTRYKKHNAQLADEVTSLTFKLAAAESLIKKLKEESKSLKQAEAEEAETKVTEKILERTLERNLDIVCKLKPSILLSCVDAKELLGCYTELLFTSKGANLEPLLTKAVCSLCIIGARKGKGFPSKAIELSDTITGQLTASEFQEADFPPLKQYYRDPLIQKALVAKLSSAAPQSFEALYCTMFMTDSYRGLTESLSTLKESLETSSDEDKLLEYEFVDKLLVLLRAHKDEAKSLVSEVLLCLSISHPDLLAKYTASPLFADIVESAVQDSSLFKRSHDVEENLIVLLAKLVLSSPSGSSLPPSIRQTLEARRAQLSEESFLHKNISAIL